MNRNVSSQVKTEILPEAESARRPSQGLKFSGLKCGWTFVQQQRDISDRPRGCWVTTNYNMKVNETLCILSVLKSVRKVAEGTSRSFKFKSLKAPVNKKVSTPPHTDRIQTLRLQTSRRDSLHSAKQMHLI